MIAIVDYDAGNLKSVVKAFDYIKQEVFVTRDPNEILKADKVILPGVGAFGVAMEKLEKFNLIDTLKSAANSGKPFLGICLGMQLLFESSEELGATEGLSLLKGHIVKIPYCEGLKVPHMGWNSLNVKPEARLFKGLPEAPYVYFVHSYYLEATNSEEVAATTEYAVTIHASIEKDNIFGCQFHPEKSGDIGIKILKNFIDI